MAALTVTRSLAFAFLITAGARLSAQRTNAPPTVIGCYAVSRDAWPAALHSESGFHRIPPHLRLGAEPRDARSWRLSPDMFYPRSGGFPPRWNVSGDSLVRFWSNGYTPTRVVVAADAMTGYAVALNDTNSPEVRIRITLRREPCKGGQ